MKPVSKFSKHYRITISDVDFMKKLKVSAAFNYFQEIAGLHAENLGIGFKTLEQKYGVFWVLTRMRVDFLRYPIWDEEIIVETWPQTPRKYSCTRDYLMKDCNGNIISRAVSQWVMSDTLRGSWPEISEEPIVAYFSPPAGLFVQSVIEAVYGLQINKPKGILTVAPSFPDSWPQATLDLPDFSAEYKKDDNTVEYVVQSKEPLKRQLRWMLPPSDVQSVKVNGRKVKFDIS